MADTDDLTLGQLRQELRQLLALAETAERPKPHQVNPRGHAMPGHEWRVEEEAVPGARPPMWVVRSVDEPENCDGVFVAHPDPYRPHGWEADLEFLAMSATDARRLAMALLAAADRADHLAAGVPRLEDRRTR